MDTTLTHAHTHTHVAVRSKLQLPLVLFAVLNGLDLLTTFWALHLGAIEFNPLTSPYIHSTGTAFAVKVLVVAAVIWLITCRTAPKSLQRALGQAWFSVGVYAVVILNNIEVIRIMLGHH